MSERRIIGIPAVPKLPAFTRVAIYCRVSTNHTEQESSLIAQIDRYQGMVKTRSSWILVGTYSDVASGRDTAGRSDFTRLMEDCKLGKIDMVITKSISRFGRNTVDILSNIRELRKHDIDVFFENEGIHTSDSASELILSMISAVAQEDSASKSQNIRIGIEHKLTNGTSRLYSRPCYGYKNDANHNLVIDEKQAKNVKRIFDLYLQGHSVVSIIRELKKRRIISPSGKDVWSKRAVETLLVNEKYIGNVIIGKTFKDEFPSNKRRVNNGERKKYEMTNDHEPIIQREVFDKVQQDHKLRSNIGMDAGKTVRKSTRYSMESLAIKKVV